MKFKTFIRNEGFTLIELMIVVGIIGILVSISGPMYNKYQRKARQSEAKLALSSMYALEKAFYSEYSAYVPSFDAIGHQAEGNSRWYTTALCGNPGPWAGTVAGYAGVVTTNVIYGYNTPSSSYSNAGYLNQAGCSTLTACSAVPNNPQTFTGWSNAALCDGCYLDAWTINQNKILINCSDGTR